MGGLERWELEREKIRASIVEAETQLARSRAAADISERHIVRLLNDLSGTLDDLPMKEQCDVLRGLIEHFEIDPVTLQGRACFRFAAFSGDKLASPWAFERKLKLFS